MVASKCAGLKVKAHACQGLAGPAAVLNPAVLAAFRILPVTVESAGDVTAIWGLPPALLLAIVRSLSPHAAPCHPVAWPCRCKLKTAVVPVAGMDRWRAMMTGGIFEGRNITRSWPYLGAAAACPHPGPGAALGRWHPAALTVVQTQTWAPGMAKLVARATEIQQLRSSFGIRAAEWNMYAGPFDMPQPHRPAASQR